MRRLLRWVFRSALTTRDSAIRYLQTENRALALEVAMLKANRLASTPSTKGTN